MRLVTFAGERGGDRVGVQLDGELADLSAVDGGPASMLDLLEGAGDDLAAAVGRWQARAPRVDAAGVRLRAPVPRPPKFLAIGLNTTDHRDDLSLRVILRNLPALRLVAGYKVAHPRPRYPLFFAKATSCVTGPYDPIWAPSGSDRADYEGEVAAVIGRRSRHLTPARAREAIVGLTLTNDVSVRDWQGDNPTGPMLGKGYETHGPLGPAIVTWDELADDLELRTLLNGERRQTGRLSDLVRSPAEVVSILSQFCTLEPGDVVACGTWSGVGFFAGRFLRPGDVVRIEADGLGHIENPVIAEPTAAAA